MTAQYSGDITFAPSNSFPQPLIVSATPVGAVTLSASATTAIAGRPVTLTAAVASPSGSGTPTGNVTFQIGRSALGAPVNLNSGTAALTVSNLPAGVDSLYALYNGDSSFGANTSDVLNVIVAGAPRLSISPGTIDTVAGSFTANGLYGEGGPARAAFLGFPTGVAFDALGNLYVSDTGNATIRAIPTTGNTTLLGVPTPVAGDIYTVAGQQPSNGNANVCQAADRGSAAGGR